MTNIGSFLRKSPLYPALMLESYFNRQKRKLLIKAAKYLLCSIPIIIILGIIFGNWNVINPNQTVNFLTSKLLGLVLITFGIYLLMHMFEAYFASVYYFEYVSKNNYQPRPLKA